MSFDTGHAGFGHPRRMLEASLRYFAHQCRVARGLRGGQPATVNCDLLTIKMERGALVIGVAESNGPRAPFVPRVHVQIYVGRKFVLSNSCLAKTLKLCSMLVWQEWPWKWILRQELEGLGRQERETRAWPRQRVRRIQGRLRC